MALRGGGGDLTRSKKSSGTVASSSPRMRGKRSKPGHLRALNSPGNGTGRMSAQRSTSKNDISTCWPNSAVLRTAPAAAARHWAKKQPGGLWRSARNALTTSVRWPGKSKTSPEPETESRTGADPRDRADVFFDVGRDYHRLALVEGDVARSHHSASATDGNDVGKASVGGSAGRGHRGWDHPSGFETPPALRLIRCCLRNHPERRALRVSSTGKGCSLSPALVCAHR